MSDDDRLRQSQLDLLRAEQLAALGQLAAGLAHELRNPLTAMKILVQSAAESGEAAVLSGKDVAVLDEELTRLEQSLDKFLDFARPPRVQRQSFDVRVVVQGVLDLVAARAARQRVAIRCQLPEARVELRGDHVQIRQVLLNTVLNALDALPGGREPRQTMVLPHDGTIPSRAAARTGSPAAGEVAVEVLCESPTSEAIERSSEAGAPWVVVRVRDNGPGIPKELGRRIFDPFVSAKETGLGLGLAICRQIVEAHGGVIDATSSDGGGTEILIRLPAEGVPAPPDPQG